MFIKKKQFINWFWRWWILFFVRKIFCLSNSIFASWLYFFTLKNNVINCNWDRETCITWLKSSLKNISLNFEFSLYILLCFWILSIDRIFVVYYNILKLFLNDRRILFSFCSSLTCRCRFLILFSFKFVSWNIKRDTFFIRIIARNQMSIEFIIKSDILFADRTETLVRHYLIREKKHVSR